MVGLVLVGLTAAVVGATMFNKPEAAAPPAPVVPQGPPPWPPELVAALKDAEGAVQDLVGKDDEMREALPRLAREAKAKLTTPKTNILREFQELDIDRAFEAKKVAWVEKKVELEARIAGRLISLRKKYGWDDGKLADECGRILKGLGPTARPWPPLK